MSRCLKIQKSQSWWLKALMGAKIIYLCLFHFVNEAVLPAQRQPFCLIRDIHSGAESRLSAPPDCSQQAPAKLAAKSRAAHLKWQWLRQPKPRGAQTADISHRVLARHTAPRFICSALQDYKPAATGAWAASTSAVSHCNQPFVWKFVHTSSDPPRLPLSFKCSLVHWVILFLYITCAAHN